MDELVGVMEPLGAKFAWFLSNGYAPHYYQSLFHAMQTGDRLTRSRHLVAGRRGGKTLSAAWEVSFYALHPAQFHIDAHQKASDEPLHIWILVPDYRSSGRASEGALRKVFRMLDLREGSDFKWNRGDKFIEFSNGSLIEFKTAQEPDKLVGAGLDILWIDEAAAIPRDEAWNYARPALSDKLGLIIGTTTPRGKNWYYDLFWSDEALEDPNVGSVEYRSIDNPFFPAEEWREVKRRYHPLLFKQEYMASFDSMTGVALQGDWLNYYTLEDLPKEDGSLKLRKYIGVDPAISLSDTADKFAMALIGVTEDGTQAFLLKTFRGRVPFPEQLQLIQSWFVEHRPMYIAVEANAYQRALVQQIERIPGFPPVVDVTARGKKWERILSMSPWFRLGKVRIHSSQRDFIDEWLGYDPEHSNPNDDLLDAVNIALSVAGVLLPSMAEDPNIVSDKPASSIEELAQRHLQAGAAYPTLSGVDDDLGGEW